MHFSAQIKISRQLAGLCLLMKAFPGNRLREEEIDGEKIKSKVGGHSLKDKENDQVKCQQ